MSSPLKEKLTDFQRVELPENGSPPDTEFADRFLKVFTRMAKAQMKTQQSASFSADEVKRHLEEHGDLVENLKSQRNKSEDKNEQLTRFAMEVMDLITNFEDSARRSKNSEMSTAAETMRKALEASMEKVGFRLIPSVGKVPDSLYHYVLDTKNADSPNEEDRIAEVVRPGYVLNGEVVRKAEVIVAQ